MVFRFTRLSAAAAACAALMTGQASAQSTKAAPAQAPAAAPAQGQQQQPQGPMKIELISTGDEWVKVCGQDTGNQKKICYTTRDFSTAKDQPPALAVAVYDVQGDDSRVFRLLTPVGLLLRPGFRFSVDKGAQQDGAFEICMPNGCFAEAKVKGTTVDSLKKGTTLNVVFKNSMNNELTFTLPITGFGKAFDGAAMDPKELQAKQEAVQKELQKQLEAKAKAQREQLEKGAAPSAGSPAPAAAPAATAPKQ